MSVVHVHSTKPDPPHVRRGFSSELLIDRCKGTRELASAPRIARGGTCDNCTPGTVSVHTPRSQDSGGRLLGIHTKVACIPLTHVSSAYAHRQRVTKSASSQFWRMSQRKNKMIKSKCVFAFPARLNDSSAFASSASLLGVQPGLLQCKQQLQ